LYVACMDHDFPPCLDFVSGLVGTHAQSKLP
jgi:hypothetical protein